MNWRLWAERLGYPLAAVFVLWLAYEFFLAALNTEIPK